MVFAGERCVKLHRIMLSALGLWPYHKSFIWRIQSVFFFGAHCSTLFSQLLLFITSACNMDCTLKRFCYICATIIPIMSYYSFYFNSENLKRALQHMLLDWKMFENSDAIKIFEEYLFVSYIFTLFSCISVLIAGVIFSAVECRYIILDVIAPMNESRSRKIEMEFELFVNEEQYFFLYLVLEIVGVEIGVWLVLSTGTFLTTVAQHSCAVYKIVSYLIRNTVTIHTLQLPPSQRMQFMRRNIYLSIYMHRRTLELCKGLLLSFDMWYFPLILICVLSLSCVLFRLYNGIIHSDDFYDILVPAVMLCCYIVYMLLANFLGQSYSEHSVELLESTYDIYWYVAPLPIQKLFLIMQKSIKSHKIMLGGLFVLSIEGFSTLVTSAISYFTVMHAMRS
ncbi:hypothetical protein DMN91_010376 [Ooceraea biroi]|uniref:Odorant receptor n=2 Tax=Ooceraea biroi TaxID=2015173 RepID=A0A026VWV2_OOCBI|nr:uncharacterized protein LOC105285759 isoform X1 [Ooceraea biroi]EZA48232.1 hypothetical protein X777_14128 [Ooceraea biroi]RLU18133.1 hypothetical protein DMN91_010376 [Ooceraea biroi]